MAGIFGHLNLSDSDYIMSVTVGQQIIWDTAMEYIAESQRMLDAALSLFVERATDDYKFRYKLPSGGYLQRRAHDGSYAAVKGYGQWDVAFPLEDFGARLASNDVDIAYMTVGELDRWISTVVIQNVNTVRYELLRAIFNNTQDSFIDPLLGTLLVEPLANDDAVVYPPVIGSEDEATEDHYLESGYLTAAISDTNNPYVTMSDDLVHHFGEATNPNIAVIINTAERAKTEALTDYDEVFDRFIRPGADADVLVGVPSGIPGEVIGRVSGVWVSVWSWIPATYMFGVSLDAESPVIKRVDLAGLGLGSGLSLVAEDEEFPFKNAFWRHRFGFGVGNRLNGIMMELGTGGTYTVPTGF